jgi:two-component system cell cycle response regulator
LRSDCAIRRSPFFVFLSTFFALRARTREERCAVAARISLELAAGPLRVRWLLRILCGGVRMERGEPPSSRLDRSSDEASSSSGLASESTIKFSRSTTEFATLAALRATLPPDEPITGEREIGGDGSRFARSDTPHTFVLPVTARADRATLTMLRGPAVGASFSLERDETTLGRGSAVDIQVDELSVSRRHARIVSGDDGGYFIEDLGSTNGTFVGGRPVRRAELQTGDRIQIGREYAFRFAIVDQEEETLQRRLYESSTRDTLTNLVNRRCLFERLTTELERSRRDDSDLCVLMIDVDHFKQVNDRFGHAAGDQVLRAIALTGGAALREGDLFARYGGEEFAVLARCATRSDGAELAERLRRAMADLRVEVGGGQVTVTVSVGLALLSECGIEDGLELFTRADARLYAAKLAGRNTVCAAG